VPSAPATPRPAKLDGELIRYVNLKLSALGEPISRSTADSGFMEIAGPLLRNHYQKDPQLGGPHGPADVRNPAFRDA
jgi:hypothetical protein